jgi:O-antigen ligase
VPGAAPPQKGGVAAMTIELIDLFLTAVVLAAFIGGLHRGIAALIIIRPLCDRVFELAKFGIGGYELTYGAVLNLVVICAALVGLQRINNKVQITLERAWLPFLFLMLIAALYSPVQIDAIRKFLTYVSYMAMFILPFVMVKTKKTTEQFFKLIILSSVLPVIYGLFQTVTGLDWYQDNRIESTFTHPNIFAFYLLTIIATILCLLATNRVQLSRNARRLLSLYLLPLLFLLVMTKTRSAWVACLFVFVVYGIVQDKRVLVAMLALPVLALAVPDIRDRLTALTSGNQYVGWVQHVNPYAWRKILWTKAFPMILQRPLFGHGLYSFPYYSPTFFPLEKTRGVDAHNVYIQLLFETGVAGLAAYLWIFWRKFLWLRRYWAFDKRGLTMAAAMMGAYLITCYSDNLLEYVSYGWCYWFTAGLIFADLSQYRVLVSMPAEQAPIALQPAEAAHVRNT